MKTAQMQYQPYTLDEVQEILSAVENEEFDLESFARRFKRSPHGLKMVVWFNKKFQTDPDYVKNFSRNMYELLSRYYQSNGHSHREENPNNSALIARDMEEQFKTLQSTMNEYIDAVVEERVAQQMGSVEQELTELREFRERAMSLLK